MPANNLTSNITRKVARVFLDAAESSRVLSKSVNRQLLQGKFTPQSGAITDFKRPHDYIASETADGDISGETKSHLTAGKASGVVQNWITTAVEWGSHEEALELDQLKEILAPQAVRVINTLEKNLGSFMLNNSGLVAGDPDTAITKWSDISQAGALLQATGVPNDGAWRYVMNPFNTTALADTQAGLASGDNRLVTVAWEKAQITSRFGGLMAMTSNALSTRTASANVDRAGTLAATPDATYLTAKDTYQQTLQLAGMGAGSETIKAGDILEFPASNRLNLATRDVVIGADGSPVLWTAVVLADVVMAGGAATVVVSGPALIEADGQYNTVDRALTSGDVVNILGTEAKVYQPNLFFHEQAFGLGTVKLPKLFSTDTVAISEDGFSLRVSKYSDGDANTQKMRVDILPAFAVFNPLYAGQGFGTP